MAFHKWVEIFKREFLAIGKNGPFGKVRDYWFRFEYQEVGCIYMAWYGVKPTASRTM